jgi:hypothetical protein
MAKRPRASRGSDLPASTPAAPPDPAAPSPDAAPRVPIRIAWVRRDLVSLSGDFQVARISSAASFRAEGALAQGDLSSVSGSVVAFGICRIDPPPAGWPAKRGTDPCLLCYADSSRRFFFVHYGSLLQAPPKTPALALGCAWRNAVSRQKGTVGAAPAEGAFANTLPRGGFVGTEFPCAVPRPLAAAREAQPAELPEAAVTPPAAVVAAGREGAAARGACLALPVVSSKSLPLDAARDVVLLGAVPAVGAPAEVAAAYRSGACPALLLRSTARSGVPTQWAWVHGASEREEAVDLSEFIVRRSQAPETATSELACQGAVLLLALVTVQSGPRRGMRSILAACGDPARLHVFIKPKRGAPLGSSALALQRCTSTPGRTLGVTLRDAASSAIIDVVLHATVQDPRASTDAEETGAQPGKRADAVTRALWQQVLHGRAAADAAARDSIDRVRSAAAEAAAAAAAHAAEPGAASTTAASAASATAAAAAAAAAAGRTEAASQAREVLAEAEPGGSPGVDVSADVRVSVGARGETVGGFISRLPSGAGLLISLAPEAGTLAARFESRRHRWRRPGEPATAAEAVGADIAERNAARAPLAGVAVITPALATRIVVPAPAPDRPFDSRAAPLAAVVAPTPAPAGAAAATPDVASGAFR